MLARSLSLSLSHLVILIYNKPPPNQDYIMFTESVGPQLSESTAGMSYPHHVWGLSCDDSLQRETQKAGICFQGGYLTRPVAPCQAWLEGWAQLGCLEAVFTLQTFYLAAQELRSDGSCVSFYDLSLSHTTPFLP